VPHASRIAGSLSPDGGPIVTREKSGSPTAPRELLAKRRGLSLIDRRCQVAHFRPVGRLYYGCSLGFGPYRFSPDWLLVGYRVPPQKSVEASKVFRGRLRRVSCFVGQELGQEQCLVPPCYVKPSTVSVLTLIVSDGDRRAGRDRPSQVVRHHVGDRIDSTAAGTRTRSSQLEGAIIRTDASACNIARIERLVRTD